MLLDALELVTGSRRLVADLCLRLDEREEATGGAVSAAAAAYGLCMRSFEALMAVWLAHAAMDAALRFEAADVAAFSRRPEVAASLELSPFATAMIRQLRALG